MAKKKNGRYIQSKGNRFEKNTDTVHTESTRHINHKDKYIGLNERTENHNIHNPPDITQKETGSSFQTEKQKKDMRKQIDSFQKEEKESRDAVTENAGNSLTVDNGRAGFEDNTKTYKTFAEGTRHKDKSVDVNEDTHSYGWKKNVRINRRQYKAHLEDNFSKVKSEDENKSKSNQKKYFKGNFEEKEFTRNKGNKDRKKENKDNRISQKSAKKFEKQEKKISKLQHKKKDLEKKLCDKKNNNLSSKGAIVAVGAVNRYLESGKEDNAGVHASQKVTKETENLVRKAYTHGKKKVLKQRKKIAKLDKSIAKKEKKLFFQKNMAQLKGKAEYKNTSRIRQFFKRMQYKKQIKKKYKGGLKNRIKKSLVEGMRKFTELIKAKGKKIVFLLLLAVGIFFMLSQAGSMLINFGSTVVSNTASTTYLSSEDVLRDINQDFSSLEQGLQEEMDSVEANYPGYDEYIVNGQEHIGHNVHELLSYITSRYGTVKDIQDIRGELQQLFQQMYTLTYKEEIEIRYRTVTTTYTDENGDTHTSTHEEPYEYKKLIVNLDKKEMDPIVREVFQAYPNNLSHYEALLASRGNMENIFGSGSGDFSEIITNPDFSNPGIEFNEESVKAILAEAERHIGKRYVFGANGPNNFDCSSFVCWTYTHSGIKNMPRTTAWGIYKNYCNPVSPSEAKAGDIIFFKNTYNSGSPISHVGIYVGNGYMIHAGDPIRYVRVDTPYWKEHFYAFGRPR